MKDSIIYFYNRNYVIDSGKYITVSVENNLVYLKSIDRTDSNNCVKVRVSSYANIVKILSFLGYEIIE